MLLNGLGFSNRRLYLVSQSFAAKPVEHLLGPGVTAEMLHDDGLRRTLDWLHDHDPTALFAGIARQACQREQIALLVARVQELEARLTKDSHSSSKPPSRTGLDASRARPRVCARTAAGSRAGSLVIAARPCGWSPRQM
jgi:hypothetical protein